MGARVDTGSWAAPGCWRFAHVRYDETRALLLVRDREVPLDRSGLALLSFFLRHAGEVVHKDTLLEVGWPGRIVAENTLAKAISRLRHALDDDDAQLLRVAHGYGYRLAAKVERIDGAGEGTSVPRPDRAKPTGAPGVSPRPKWGVHFLDASVVLVVASGIAFAFAPSVGDLRGSQAKGAIAAKTDASIAVLPFADLSQKQDQQYFADGLAEELLDHLARLDGLRVVSRTSSFALRDSKDDVPTIGRVLGVRHVLEGSVRRSGDRIRVTVQLIDARTGFHLWSQTYDRPMSELFALQDEIVVRIVESLRVELEPLKLRAAARHGTLNPDAFREYLYGLSVERDETSGRRAMMAFRRAVALDPQFFDAWLALALALDYDSVFPDSAAEVTANKHEALAIMERLVRMRPRQANLYLRRGDMLFWHWRDMAGAQRDFERAAQLGMREDVGWMVMMSRVHAATGRMAQAMELTAKATSRDPSSNAWVVRAYHLLGTGRVDEARAAARQSLRRYPEDEHAHYYLGLCDLLQGRPREAMAHFDDTTHHFRLTGMAMAQHSLGDRAASERHLQRLVQTYGHVQPYLVADVHAWRSENDSAYAWMQRSVDVRDASLAYLAFDPLIAPLRKDARWPGLLRQVRLDRYLLPSAKALDGADGSDRRRFVR